MSKVTITPSRLAGTAQVPPSKSVAHRMLICAALAKGESLIENIVFSRDIAATVSALGQMGAVFIPEGHALRVRGTGGRISAPADMVDCGESGSTLRFLLPLFSLCGEEVVFTGAPRLFQRPLSVYADIFARQGLDYKLTGNRLKIYGKIQPGRFAVPGNISSQFISGLLFALSCLKEQSCICITGKYESESYVELSVSVLEKFGIKINKNIDNQMVIPGGQRYVAGSWPVEGDWSQAAALMAIGALGEGLWVTGLEAASRQGDRIMIEILKKCGVNVVWENGALWAGPGKEGLHSPGQVDLADCPDLGPVLCAFLLFCRGETELTGAGRLRLKESDRIACVEEELRKFGAQISSTEDRIFITGGTLREGPPAYCHNDHRIAMALAVLALGAKIPLEMQGADAVAKSWPTFFHDLAKLGLVYREEDI